MFVRDRIKIESFIFDVVDEGWDLWVEFDNLITPFYYWLFIGLLIFVNLLHIDLYIKFICYCFNWYKYIDIRSYYVW